MSFNIEFGKAVITQAKKLAPAIKYNFELLKNEGDALFFTIPAGEDYDKAYARIRTAASNFATRKNVKLRTTRLTDGRVQVYRIANDGEDKFKVVEDAEGSQPEQTSLLHQQTLVVGNLDSSFAEWLDSFEPNETKLLEDMASWGIRTMIKEWCETYAARENIKVDCDFVTDDSKTAIRITVHDE